MQLYVEEIETEVSQVFIPHDHKEVWVVRPHLYIKNRPAGTLKVQICTQDGTLLAESDAMTISTITNSNEFHGYVSFYVAALLMKDTPYAFKVVAGSPYSFSESGYCAVVKDAGFQKYEHSNPIPSFYRAPFDFEIWTKSFK